MKYSPLTAPVLAALLCLNAILPAPSQAFAPPPYAVTVDGDLGRPFSSPGYSGRLATAGGALLSLEFRPREIISYGASLGYNMIRESGTSTDTSYLDLFCRVLPWRHGSLEPYALLGMGSLLSASGSDPAHTRVVAIDLDMALGFFYNFGPLWALDAAIDYRALGPSDSALNYADLRLGAQYRFGVRSWQEIR